MKEGFCLFKPPPLCVLTLLRPQSYGTPVACFDGTQLSDQPAIPYLAHAFRARGSWRCPLLSACSELILENLNPSSQPLVPIVELRAIT